MIDTQKIQSAPKCVSGVAEAAATLAARDDDHCTHAVEIATCFPLDVETLGRMVENLSERDGFELLQTDGVCYLRISNPEDYNIRSFDIDAGEHLRANTSLLKHLSELRSDPLWVRKVKEQHELLRIAAASKKTRRFELSYFTNRAELPSARIQSTLNDLGASGHIYIDVDQDAGTVHYIFPNFSYPKARHQQNMTLLDELQPHAEKRNVNMLAAALGIAVVLIVLLFIFNS